MSEHCGVRAPCGSLKVSVRRWAPQRAVQSGKDAAFGIPCSQMRLRHRWERPTCFKPQLRLQSGRPLSWPSPTEQVQGTLNITSGNMVMIAQCRFSHSREHLRMTLGAQPDARAGAFFPRRRQLTTDDATGMAFPKHLTEIDSYQAVPPQGQSGTATRYVLVPSRGASVCAKPHHIHEIPGFLKPLFSAGTQI